MFTKLKEFLRIRKKEESVSKKQFKEVVNSEDVKEKLNLIAQFLKTHHRKMKDQHKSLENLVTHKKRIKKNIKKKTLNIIKERLKEGIRRRSIVEELLNKTDYSESSIYRFIRQIESKEE